MVSFASSIGATLAMLAARFLLRDWVQQRFETYLKTINEGMLKEGGFYLFTLRLVPVIPFFVINLVMGLMPIHWWTFYWVSQIGMLAGTLVFVNAGAELGQIESAGDILSPMLIGSFILLGIFPLIMKRCWGGSKPVVNKFESFFLKPYFILKAIWPVMITIWSQSVPELQGWCRVILHPQ